MIAPRLARRLARQLLLAGVGGGFVPGASAAADNCTVDGNVVTCRGDQSQGVLGGSDRDFVRSTTNLLEVQNLDQNISVSLSGTGGIDFQSDQNYSMGDIEVDFDDPTFSVINSAGPGIVLSSTGNPTTRPRNLTVTANGDVSGDAGSPGVSVLGAGQAGLAGTGDGQSGAGAASLDVADDRQIYLALQPAVEVGADVATADGWLLRPRLALGLTRYLTDPSPTAQARFAAAPATPSFATTSHVERTWLALELGVDVLATNSVVLGLNGLVQLAEGASHAGA